MQGFTYHTKHFDGFNIVLKNDTAQSFIVSETDPEGKPLIGPFKTPAMAITFGINRVEQIK